MGICEQLIQLKEEIGPNQCRLIAVSKTKPLAALQEAYAAGQRDFGENKVQEMCDKAAQLPKDIHWHLIGHLQSNKVKYIVDFVHLIHSVDSLKLLLEIEKQAAKKERKVDCLLQMHIAEEETKFGLSAAELEELVQSEAFSKLQWVRMRGLMGMATFTEDEEQIRKEFRGLKQLFEQVKGWEAFVAHQFDTLSMGMSGDYRIAMEEGSSMIRVGSAIFGERNYTKA
jgi:PLP dependent protein